MARQHARPDPLTQGKGRRDEVDQSKGIFPPGVAHPKDAEVRAPGALGGGPYDESGRGGIAVSAGASPLGAGAKQATAQPETGSQEDEREAKEREPAGALPQHEERRQ